jgi:subtilisin family serine protease/Tfp pilus assembly protein PilZ
MLRLFLFLVISVSLLDLGHSQSITQSYVPGEVIVKFKNQNSDGSKLSISSAHSKIASKRKLKAKKTWSHLNAVNYKIDSQKTVSQTIQELKSDPEVEYAEPNYYVSITRSIRESQTMSVEEAESYAAQNYYENATGLPYDQTGAPVSIPEAWSHLSYGNPEVVVAVIDTGIDFRNNLLKDAKWTNPGEIPNDGIDNDNNGYIDDYEGWDFVENDKTPNDCNDHGTHVAGIIRGATQDIIGVSAESLASTRIRLMALKFLDCSGIGTTADAIQAIYYAANKGARILNNSWGGGAYSIALHEAIAYTYTKNTLFVAAAGNSGINIDSSPTYPASYNVPNVLSVGASNSFDYSASFSNYGINNVHIGSPGVGVLSTVACNPADISCSYTASMTGTSMAAPFVAGIAAMMMYEQPAMIGYQVKNLLLSNIDVPMAGGTPKLNGRVKNGGRVNAQSSVLSAKSSSVDSSAPGYDVSANLIRSPASEAAGGCGLVQKVYQNYDNDQNSGTPTHPLSVILVLAILAAPLVLAVFLSKNPKNQRRFERFYMPTQVQIFIGNSEYLGQVGTISLGGLSFNSNAIFKLGNPVDMKISSPDGKESIKVSGQVVWMSNTQNYGVKFTDTEEQALIKINDWTQNLKKAF